MKYIDKQAISKRIKEIRNLGLAFTFMNSKRLTRAIRAEIKRCSPNGLLKRSLKVISFDEESGIVWVQFKRKRYRSELWYAVIATDNKSLIKAKSETNNWSPERLSKDIPDHIQHYKQIRKEIKRFYAKN